MFRTVPRFARFPTSALEWVVSFALAVDVFLTACGSSSVAGISDVGRPGRWLALVALAGSASLLAFRVRHGAPSRDLLSVAAPVAALAALALVSTGYSIEPRLTLERAVTLVFALGAALALGYAAEDLPELPRRALAGLAAGAVAVAAAGVLVYAADRHAAVQAARPGVPARWRGLGENPNTISMLAALGLALALWLALTRAPRRGLWAAGAAGLVLTILASGSRGALAAGAAGALAVVGTVRVPRRLQAVGAVAVVACALGGAAVVDAITTPGGSPPTQSTAQTATAPSTSTAPSTPGQTTPSQTSTSPTVTAPKPRPAPPPTRSFTTVGSSGRTAAWRRAFHLGNGRPVLGYGFGTEERVFIPRFALFNGTRPENSFLGLYLQLGAAGVLLFALVLLAAVRAFVPAIRRGVQVPAAASGVLAAGCVLLLVQSYVYSVGNVGAVTFWVTIAAGVAAAGRGQS